MSQMAVSIMDRRPNRMATYSVSTPAFAISATPTDIVSLAGSASKTVRITRVELNALQTVLGINNWSLVKRSAANTGGTFVATTSVPHDSLSPVATAVAGYYTANASGLGTALGIVRSTQILAATLTSVISSPSYIWTFDLENSAKGITLHGVAESLALNFGGVALPLGLAIGATITWTEE